MILFYDQPRDLVPFLSMTISICFVCVWLVANTLIFSFQNSLSMITPPIQPAWLLSNQHFIKPVQMKNLYKVQDNCPAASCACSEIGGLFLQNFFTSGPGICCSYNQSSTSRSSKYHHQLGTAKFQQCDRSLIGSIYWEHPFLEWLL